MGSPKLVLTARQHALLRYIRQREVKRDLSPTLREMCLSFGWASVHTAHCHVRALILKGALTHLPAKARSLRITPAGLKALR